MCNDYQLLEVVKTVKKRKIFYIPGFDPRSASYYSKLLFKNFPELKLTSTKKAKGHYCYKTDDLEVDYEILSWHKNVRNHWLTGLIGNFHNVKDLFVEFVFKGCYKRGSEINFRKAVQTAFPIYFYLIWALIAFLTLYFLSRWLYIDYGVFGATIAVFTWLALNYAIYLFFEKAHLFWVTRIMRFFAIYANQKVPDVIEFEHEVEAKVRAALESDEFDEVLLVGHSAGTILTVDVLANMEAKGKGKNLNVITLGHCVVGVYVVKNAGWFKHKLKTLANREAFWIDVTAARDLVNFYKMNPAYYEASKPDLNLSARFHKTFHRSLYDSLKWNFYKIHMLYLYKPDFPNESDFNYKKLLTDAKLIENLKESLK